MLSDDDRMRVARSVAKRRFGHWPGERDDLLQTVHEGICRAERQYDPARTAVSLWVYAWRCADRAVVDAIRVTLGTTGRKIQAVPLRETIRDRDDPYTAVLDRLAACQDLARIMPRLTARDRQVLAASARGPGSLTALAQAEGVARVNIYQRLYKARIRAQTAARFPQRQDNHPPPTV